MHLNKLLESKTGRTFLSFQETKRVKGRNKTTTIERIGYLDEFEGIYDDPIAHFKQIAKQRTPTHPKKRNLSTSMDKHFDFDKEYVKGDSSSHQIMGQSYNLGMLALSQIFHELELDYFLNMRRRYTKAKFNHNIIFQMLVYGRILFPESKLKTWQHRYHLLGNMDFTDDDVYRSLGFFAKHKNAMIQHLHKKITKLYGRDTSLMFYDVTNYYWEIDEEDDFRKRGCCKEHKPEPIVQMGLLMDSKSLPITYGLFPGNTNDCLTLSPMMGEVCEDLRAEGVIYIADKGMMSGDNRAEILVNRGGYVFSNSVRGADEDTKKYVVEESGFTHNEDGTYKYKSRIVPIKMYVTDFSTGKKRKVTINERQIVFWSKKYQTKTRYEREKAIDKATRYGSSENTHGGNRFFKNIVVNKIDGEVIEKKEYIRLLDEDLISKEEALDGYYMICTNVVGLEPQDKSFNEQSRFLRDNMFQLNKVVTDHDIIEMYRGLWKIEESFRITKSYLKARPVFVHKEENIEAHFLTCFISLLIIRILEIKTHYSIEVNKMIEDLRKVQVAEIEDDVYLLINSTNILKKIGDYLDLDLVKNKYEMQELKKLLAKTRKTSQT